MYTCIHYTADTKLGDVKIGKLGEWLGRRSFAPASIARAGSRASWRWAQNYLIVKRPTVAPLVHIIGITSFISYLLVRSTLC